MPLKLKKKAAAKPATKGKAKVETKPALKAVADAGVASNVIDGYETVVDRLAVLEVILTPKVIAALKEQEKLEKELRSAADEHVPADTKAVFVGSKKNFTVTEKSEQRQIDDVREAQVALGDPLFYQCAKVSLGDIDKYLTDAQKSFITVKRVGHRKGELVAK